MKIVYNKHKLLIYKIHNDNFSIHEREIDIEDETRTYTMNQFYGVYRGVANLERTLSKIAKNDSRSAEELTKILTR